MPLRFIYIYIYLLVTGKPDAHHQGRENAKPQELRRWAWQHAAAATAHKLSTETTISIWQNSIVGFFVTPYNDRTANDSLDPVRSAMKFPNNG